VENLPHLVERLSLVRDRSGLELDLLLMDDDSRDGSEALVRSLALPWVRIVVRARDRGLGQAVLEGMRLSTRDILVVMDADLSHPPEKARTWRSARASWTADRPTTTGASSGG
jgi:dolichol-phosphate mannosyltransferase